MPIIFPHLSNLSQTSRYKVVAPSGTSRTFRFATPSADVPWQVSTFIAEARGVQPGVDCHSPPRHSAFRCACTGPYSYPYTSALSTI